MNMWTTVFFYAFWIAFGIQLVYLFAVYFHSFLYKENKQVNSFNEPVSIIICARNEAKNLEKNLPKYLEQHYHEYEVIVVNDRSWDNTAELLEEYEEKFKNLKIVTIPESEHNPFAGKKLAKTLGVKAAKYEHLLFTDADCVPSSESWLYKVCKEFESSDLVIGLSPLKGGKGFWAYISRFDALLIAYNYFSYALAKAPYMAVGRNMAYKKQLFFDVKGFKSHYTLPSGDDDLFVRDVLGKAKISVSASSEGLTYSCPKTNFNDWIRQKKRHFLTAPKYLFFNKFLLGLYSFSYLILLASFVGLAITNNIDWYILAAFLFRIFIFTLFAYKIFKILGETKQLLLIPFMEFILFFTNGLIYYSNTLSKPNKWS